MIVPAWFRAEAVAQARAQGAFVLETEYLPGPCNDHFRVTLARPEEPKLEIL